MSTKRKSVILKTAVFFVMFLCLMVSSFGLKTAQAASARKLNCTKKNVEVSKSFNLKVYNLQSGDKVKYATSDKNIVTISSKGVCTGVTPGQAIVAATITGKDKKTVKLTCKVTVKAMRIPTISEVTMYKDGDVIIGTSPSIAMSFMTDKTTTATISVCDSFNEAVYEKTINVTKNKTSKFTWKGLDNNGEPVEKDSYYFRVDCDGATAKTSSFPVTDTSDFSKGNGSKKNPYRIKTLDEFKLMEKHSDCHFILANDIDADYKPLQNLFYGSVFNGTLDGNDKTIKNLVNKKPIFNGAGINAVIKDLKISDANLLLDEGYSFLVRNNYGLIENCTISNVSVTKGTVGLFADNNYGIIKGCKADGKITSGAGNYHSAGIARYNQSTGEILDCNSAVNFTVANNAAYIGGIAGVNYGTVRSCVYSGTISYGCKAAIVNNNCEGVVINCSYLGSQQGLQNVLVNSGVVIE